MENWQLCPKCKGNGLQEGMYGTSFRSSSCDLCNGYKVISSLTGIPPMTTTSNSSSITKSMMDDLLKIK